MTTRDPFNAAVLALRTFIADGRFVGGAPLVTTELANELGLSPTPVREALAQLAGEGLIERRPRHGYFGRSVSVELMTDLYELHWAVLVGSTNMIRNRRETWSQPVSEAARPTVANFFRALAILTANAEVRTVQSRVWSQLLPLETDDGEVVSASLWASLRGFELDRVESFVETWHRARLDGIEARVREVRNNSPDIV